MIDGGVLTDNPIDLVSELTCRHSRRSIRRHEARRHDDEASSLSIHIKGKGGHGRWRASKAMSSSRQSSGSSTRRNRRRLSFEEPTARAPPASFTLAPHERRTATRRAARHTSNVHPEQHVEALERLRSLLHEVEAMFVVECTLDLTGVAPAVVNNADVYEQVMRSATKVVGASGVMTILRSRPATTSRSS